MKLFIHFSDEIFVFVVSLEDALNPTSEIILEFNHKIYISIKTPNAKYHNKIKCAAIPEYKEEPTRNNTNFRGELLYFFEWDEF